MSERTATWIFRGIGALMLLLGSVALVIAPLEMICFTWFSEGGRFGYEGFGFGSFLFGTLAMQIVGYYVIALLAIPIGAYHWMLRRSIRPVMLALLRIWWILGIPLLLVFLFILLASKTLTPGEALLVLVLALLSYTVLPVVLGRFYRSGSVGHVLERNHPGPTRTDALGVPVLTVAGLAVFWLLGLHVLLFFSGLFPMLTGWATGVQGLALIDGAVLTLLFLLWGITRHRRWACWGALVYFGGMAVLWVGTALHTSWLELLAVLAFPSTEVSILDGIPLQGWHLAILVGLPLAGTIAAIVKVLASHEADIAIQR